MGVLKAFLYVAAGAFALGGLVLGLLLGKATWIVGLPVMAIGLGLGAATYYAARRFNAGQAVHQTEQFEAVVRRLAEKNGGTVSLAAILSTTGESKESAQQKLRELTGRGVVDMDFGPNGELLYKLTPMDEARANLASMRERAGE